MKLLIQKQVHSTIINNVNLNTQKWQNGDGMITSEKNLGLISYGSDCAMVAFWNKTQIGICHAGWRGLVGGLLDAMAKMFTQGECFVGPLLHRFEIQEDDCYRMIYSAYGDRYFSTEAGKIIFHFQSAVMERLSGVSPSFDARNTFDHPELASWRRDRRRGDGTQNRLVVWRSDDGLVKTKLFYPAENVTRYFTLL